MKKFRLLVAIVTVLMVVLSGCGSKSLVGTWVEDSDRPETLELFSDGTGRLSSQSGFITSLTITSWLAEDDRLKITVQAPLLGEYTFVEDYEVNKDTLTLTDDDGEETIYIRQ
ncbi:MAG: hypothetical protein ACI4DW_08560 [Lachnospiraceae bacterium]